MQQGNDTNLKKEKNGRSMLEKKDSSEYIFCINFNHSQTNVKNQREKYWQNVSVNLPENISTTTETMMPKSFSYLLGTSNHLFSFIFKTSEYPVVASLCWYVYFKVFFFKKKHDIALLIFAFKKFQEMGKNLYFKVSKIAFQLIIFQYIKKHVTTIEIRTLGSNFSKLL